ncbi:MAG TPA: GxxExxY protein [Terrimicrobiaceae bacterium]|nr:GxxExxY protein [Terrimicrobiaceae bacterium]
MERDPQTFEIIGAAMEVHRELGHGFLEAVYRAALAIEFAERGIPYRAEVELPVQYKGKRLSCGYRADFICHENILVEAKAISALSTADSAQLLNYLKATQHQRGLILNFGGISLEQKRLVFGLGRNLCESVKSVEKI